jgi:hypothetical protein
MAQQSMVLNRCPSIFPPGEYVVSDFDVTEEIYSVWEEKSDYVYGSFEFKGGDPVWYHFFVEGNMSGTFRDSDGRTFNIDRDEEGEDGCIAVISKEIADVAELSHLSYTFQDELRVHMEDNKLVLESGQRRITIEKV